MNIVTVCFICAERYVYMKQSVGYMKNNMADMSLVYVRPLW